MNGWGRLYHRKVYINDIPARLAAIVSGELDMGCSPSPWHPWVSSAALIKRNYEPEDGICPDVLVFTGKR